MARRLLISTVVLLAALLVACGDDDDEAGENTPGGPPQAATSAVAEPPTEAPTEVATEAAAGSPTEPPGDGDGSQQMDIFDFGYSPESLTVASGGDVTLQLTNTGGLPHTFTIDGVVDSGVVGAGESASVSFTPNDTGTLTFYCTIHGESTMSGELTVE